MKHLLPVFLLIVLCWAVLWAQSAADSTVYVQLDKFFSNSEYSAAAAAISRLPGSSQDQYWRYLEDKILDQISHDSITADQALVVLDSTLCMLRGAGRSDSLSTAKLWIWKAYSHAALEQFTDVLDSYNEAIRIFETNEEFYDNSLTYCYNQIAQSYMRLNDNVNADKYLKSAIESDTINEYKLSSYGQLANNAYWRDSFDLGLHYFELGKKYEFVGEQDEDKLKSVAALRLAGASILIKKGRFREAKILIRQALAHYQNDPEEVGNLIRSYAGLADIAAQTGQLSDAERYFRLAEKTGLGYFKVKRKSREMAKMYCEWGDFMLDIHKDKEALHLFQKALVWTFPKFNNLDPATNPLRTDAPIEVQAMNGSARKAALLLRHPTLQTRASAADCFDLAFAVADRIRGTYGTDEAKLYFTQNNYNLHREAALNLWALHLETGDVAQLSRLLALLENNRANALRDALQEQRALALTGIPDSLLRREEVLRREIAVVQGNLSGTETDSSYQAQKRALERLERRLGDLLTFLKKNYDRFREFSQAGQTANLDSIRQALSPTAVLLSFFDASDRYLCLRLSRNGLSAYEIPRDTVLDQALLRFQILLTDKTTQEADPTAFFADAYFLKQRLLPDSILADANALVVVPDGRLAYLPFEALLTAPHTGNYGKAPYLLRTHTVQYAWSAALLTDNPAQRVPEKGLLHVAPFAIGARKGLATLPNSLHETPENAAADLLQGPQAQADTFLHSAAAYDILHLSTHAHAGQQEQQPGIEFSDRTVTLPEIYAQRLNASLVALSACETNAGQFAEGEGVLSLARAFAYAGARSLVASYWSVNDRSTANLFTAFYRHLKKGMTKSEALRQAKLDLLAEPGADARKMPYHWAAFTLSGADGPVALGGAEWPLWWMWTLMGAAVGIGLIWHWRRSRRRNRL